MTEIRELLHPDTAEGRLRAAALSLRSLCEANGWTRIRADHPDGFALTYRVGAGLELTDMGGDVLASYPEDALDAEQWTVTA